MWGQKAQRMFVDCRHYFKRSHIVQALLEQANVDQCSMRPIKFLLTHNDMIAPILAGQALFTTDSA